MNHNGTIMAMLQMGIPLEPILAMFRILQNSKHYISTAYGRSTCFHGGDNKDPEMGVGQGNGAGPTLAAILLASAVAAMKAEGYGMYLNSPLSNTLTQLVCFMFVDDTDLNQMATDVYETMEDILPTIQASIDFWGGIL